jgi:hypothetical protein
MRAFHFARKSIALCVFLTLFSVIAERSEAGEPYSNGVIRIGVLNDQSGHIQQFRDEVPS